MNTLLEILVLKITSLFGGALAEVKISITPPLFVSFCGQSALSGCRDIREMTAA